MLDNSKFRSSEERKRIYSEILNRREQEKLEQERLDSLRRKKFKKGLAVALVTGTAAAGVMAKVTYDYTAKKIQPVNRRIEEQAKIKEEQRYSKEYLVSHKAKNQQER